MSTPILSRKAWNEAGGSTAPSWFPWLGASWRLSRPPWRPSPLSYWPPSALLGAQTAVWLVLAIGVVTLSVQGARYATIEQLDRTGKVAVIALNVFLGLVIVGLEALIAH